MTTPPALHRNQQLFSDYYLNALLPTRADWQALTTEAQPVMAQLTALHAEYRPSTNEAQAEEEWVRPILKALGHTFEVQPALKTPDGTKKPDYVFYRDTASLVAQKNKTLTDALPRQGGVAVGDAKYWDRPLDMAAKAKGGDTFNNKNPSYQIAFYVQHSGVDWGILTNGRLWRLYHKDTAHKLDRYYEADLPALLGTGDAGAFLYFFGFFRRPAFDAHALGVTALLHASEDYARGVGESLKKQVYDALLHLSQGFLDYAENGLAPDAGTLKRVYDSSLILLYRLLFILYAESRELLPVAVSDLYRTSYGLHAVKQEVATALSQGKALLAGSATLWPRLKTLFGFIDKGEPPLKVATFNGGLFDPQRHPFLEQYAVGDGHLQAAIDRLARVGGQFVDYRDLSVRHLGTIYEGLLEYHLQGAEEAHHLASPHSSASQGPPKMGGSGEEGAGGGGWTVALLNDKGERKATGSYYTPDYIVKYIVERAVGPMLREAVAGQDTDAGKAAAVLGVNVLDPAMGSGHFLVEATEYIAAFLVEAALTPGADAGGGEADLLYWKRRVAQSCIYGVDLNPLAVELAKLSLWLTTVAQDRPLSFLDHHLRTGNALVGARLADLKAHESAKKGRKKASAPAKNTPALFEEAELRQSLTSAVDKMLQIENSPAETVADVKQQDQNYQEVRRFLVREFGKLASLVTSRHFGVEVDQFYWKPVASYATGKEDAALPQIRQWVADADRLAGQHSFFHWELEFPEVFFDESGKPRGSMGGFDAVIGNPPYVRQETISVFKPYLKESFFSFHSAADLYLYFFEQGVKVLRREGVLSYVTSNSWLRANYAVPLRTFLRTEATVETMVDLGDNRVFSAAPDVYPIILTLRHMHPPTEYIARAAVFTRGEGLADFERVVQSKMIPVAIHNQEDTGWQLGNEAGRKILAKLMAAGKPLTEVVNKSLYLGVKTGLNEAFIIDQATRDRLVYSNSANAAVIKPMRQGEDLRPWYQEDEGRHVIALPSGWTHETFGRDTNEAEAWVKFQEAYPELAEHLGRFAAAARERTDQGMYWWELRSCDYYPAFDKPKAFWPSIAKFPRFSWDDTGAYVNNSGFLVSLEHPWLLGLLNSRAIWFVIGNICLIFGERAGIERYQLFIQYIARLPVPDASDADRTAIGDLAMTITGRARARYALHCEVRKRIQTDFGTHDVPLNLALQAWWTLTFADLRAMLKKVYEADIPVAERDEWQAYFAKKKAEHAALTAQIVAGETGLNARVYGLFGLSADEVKVVEAGTKYGYGAV